MYREEMQVKFEYRCCPIIIGEVIALGLKKLIRQFPFIFLLMVRWIEIIFGIQMYHEEMQVTFEYGCCVIIEVIALELRKLIENDSFRSFFSSPELKAQVSFSDRPSSGVCLSTCLSVNFYIFDFFS
jgi:hypothetical protein